tara:strand:+ start:145 stop:330 length:186 start_codon:yes stop_codon:yes gene_type:complete
MTEHLKETQKLRTKAEAFLNRTFQIQKEIAELEATLSRKENQKIEEKSKRYRPTCDKKFQT